jgi:predicted transcriptional regulator YdeE
MKKTTSHPQEKILETLDYKGITVDVAEWRDTIWCGKIGYAANNTDEPDVDTIMSGFFALDHTAAAGRAEPDWDICMSVNYLSPERPNGVMVGFLVDTVLQPEDFDTYKVPAARYMRIPMCGKTAKALGREPWHGGIPPYGWIGEQIAPALGYTYGADTLPIFEYYGYYNPRRKKHKFCYLYVPVEKT